jgi:hypothetical protein
MRSRTSRSEPHLRMAGIRRERQSSSCVPTECRLRQPHIAASLKRRRERPIFRLNGTSLEVAMREKLAFVGAEERAEAVVVLATGGAAF